jgi:hypothetical protein
MLISIPVSIGELFDKYTILLIKLDKISDSTKIEHVKTEISELKPFIEKFNLDKEIFNELLHVNKTLWNIEDDIRQKERDKLFDDEFVQLARSVYHTNDKRCMIKYKINNEFNSKIIEVKSYEKY